MTLVAYDFEAATPSGTALSLGNTGANQVVTNGGTAVSDNTACVWSGSLCGKYVAAANAQDLTRYLASASNLTMSMGGGFEIDAQPANTITLGTLRGSGLAMGLRWSTANTIMIADAAGGTTNLVTSATPGSKYWVSIRATTTATANTGTWTVNIYDSTSTLVGTSSLSSKNIGTAAFTGGDFGVVDTAHAAGVTVRWDNIQFNDGSSVEITPPSSTSNINVTDAGSGADAVTVVAAVPTTDDAGTAADAVAVTAAVPVTDAGSAADAVTVTASVPLADAATAADTFTVTVTVPLTDSGTGVDTAAVTASVTLTDSGAGADSLSTGGTPIALADTAAGVDTLGVAATVPLVDTGHGADTLTATATVPLADVAAGVETLTIAAVAPLADVAHGAEALTVTVKVAVTDSGAGADTLHATNPGAFRDITVTVTAGPSRHPTPTGGASGGPVVTAGPSRHPTVTAAPSTIGS